MKEYDLGSELEYGLNSTTLRELGIFAYPLGTTPCVPIPETAAFPAQDWRRLSWARDAAPFLPRAVSLKALDAQAAFVRDGGLCRDAMVFEQGAPLPQRRTLVLAVPGDWEDIAFVLFSGDRQIGVCHMLRLDRASAGEEVELVFDLDFRGNLSVAARMRESRNWVRFDLPEALVCAGQATCAA